MAKNPRKLHFLADKQWYEVVAYKKILCEPIQAETATLVYTAKNDEREILQHWLALGYRRQALDTATGQVIKKLKLKTLAKRRGTDLLGIWISTDFLEKPKDGRLFCSIYFVFDSDSNFLCHTESIKKHVDTNAKEGWNITTFVIDDPDSMDEVCSPSASPDITD